MQFTMMVQPHRIELPDKGHELVVNLDGTIIPNWKAAYSTEVSPLVQNISGTRILVHLIDEVTTISGTKTEIAFQIPIIIRESLMVLVGSDGRKELEEAIITALKTAYGLDLQPFSPFIDSITELLKCTKRIEGGSIYTRDGVKDIEEILESLFAQTSGETEPSWDLFYEFLESNTLLSADLIFSVNHTELLLRYFLDSFWISDNERVEHFNQIIEIIEKFLIEGVQCIGGPI